MNKMEAKDKWKMKELREMIKDLTSQRRELLNSQRVLRRELNELKEKVRYT